MEGVDISGRVPRVLSKKQSRDAQFIEAQRADALVAKGDLDRGSVRIVYGAFQNLQREKQRGRGIRVSGRHGALEGIALVLLTFAGWCHHLYTCFEEGRWGFLTAGAIVSPIGIVHGWGIWLGWW